MKSLPFGDGITHSMSVTSLDTMLSRSEWSHHQRALIRSVFEYDVTLSETVSRAAQPNLHSGRLRLLLQVAARKVSAERWRNIK